jgi:hypothetical protein
MLEAASIAAFDKAELRADEEKLHLWSKYMEK